MKHDRPSRLCTNARREAILSVAQRIFSAEGFAAASMSQIAAEVGGSKGTLYHYFRNKQALFEAHIEDRCRRFAQAILDPPLPEGEIVESLAALAERVLTVAFTEDSAVFYRLVIAEAERSPAISRAFYNNGPGVAMPRIAEILERARAKGQIVADDCMRAAEEFMSLLLGHFYMKWLLKLVPNRSAAETKTEAEHIARLFMRLYGNAH